MLDHVGINVSDVPRALEFYDAVLAPLGCERRQEVAPEDGAPMLAVGYGPRGEAPVFWVGSFGEGASNREAHICFVAADDEAVRAFVEAGRALGAEVLHEVREWSEYHPGYVGGFLRDPDGNNVEACVRHAPD